MLKDEDRIFTNLYGQEDWRLDGARKRRRVGQHQGPHRPRPRHHHRHGQGVRAARARRGRLPGRHQVVLHAQGERRPAVLSRGQRRRVGARHLQGPGDSALRSPSAARGLPGGRLRHGRRGLLHLYPRRVLSGGHAPSGGDRRGLRGRPDRQERLRLRLRLRHLSCIAAPAPTSAARRPRCWKASRARRASRGSSRRFRRPSASMAARPRSTTSRPSPWCRRSCAAASPGGPPSAGPRIPAPRSSASPAT